MPILLRQGMHDRDPWPLAVIPASQLAATSMDGTLREVLGNQCSCFVFNCRSGVCEDDDGAEDEHGPVVAENCDVKYEYLMKRRLGGAR